MSEGAMAASKIPKKIRAERRVRYEVVAAVQAVQTPQRVTFRESHFAGGMS